MKGWTEDPQPERRTGARSFVPPWTRFRREPNPEIEALMKRMDEGTIDWDALEDAMDDDKAIPYYFAQGDRAILFRDVDNVKTFRKHARILARQLDRVFSVETDRGVMTGVPGDWLVTNHPDDDPGSDLWTISAERMAQTYDEVGFSESFDGGDQHRPGPIET